MDEPAELTFPTRVDLWIVALLGGAVGAAGVALLRELRADPAGAWPAALILAAVVLLVLLISVPTRYTITSSELIIRSGVLRTSIPLQAIQRVYPTRLPLSSPAWSLDRLAVVHRRGRVGSLALISPARREEFLQTLARCAGLQRFADELRREPRA